MTDEQISTWAEEALKWIIGCSDLQLATTSLIIFNRLNQNKGQNVIQAIIRTVYYHLTQNNDSQCSEPRLLSQLVGESFIMLQNYIEGNEVLLFDYVFSFLDCRMFVESSLFEAKQLLFNCMNVERVRTKIVANTISIARPLIPRLETSKDAQKILDQLIKNMQENLELQIIIAPLKNNDPSLFPSAMDVNVIFAQADDPTLCKALSHYAFMLKTSSRSILNEIYGLSSDILSKIEQNENNRISLSKNQQIKLYKFVFWPSVRAKRLNFTELTKTGRWTTESDAIGGHRQYTSDGTASKSLLFSKMWVYGTQANWHGTATISYANVSNLQIQIDV